MRRHDNALAMAAACEAPKVKLICGMISCRAELLEEAIGPLVDAFGAVDVTSDVMDFDFTRYYDRQMGSPLYRRFASFAEPAAADVLVEAKHRTGAIEADFARRFGDAAPRPINLDPGYVAPAKLVLASRKDFSHRVYLARGVYAEVTLLYRKGKWEALPWTFPDFASPRYHAFLTEARDRLRRQLREGRSC
jgi:hypothetical protein